MAGGTSDIGRAVAMKLAMDGFEVIVHGRDARRGAQTVKEIEAAGGKARFLSANRSMAGRLGLLNGAAYLRARATLIGRPPPRADRQVE
ncbi:MAG: hypothetical protein DME09_13900 [Candidatus Rokuibacteriota bacterium]|nr:MAG: hypothetical protein DME09_13900 [Candidatus Rokubacteria bacterium]